jgi:hypothetical protein
MGVLDDKVAIVTGSARGIAGPAPPRRPEGRAYERMVAERPKDTKVALVLMQAREDLQALDAAASSAKER